MNAPVKQHLIDPEICIRCYTCEMTCPAGAIEHDDNNVVVDAEKCNFCMDCIAPCPTGSIDEWRVVSTPYSLEDQYSWMDLPEQESFDETKGDSAETSLEALDDSVAQLLTEAHQGAGGKSKAPASAAKPSINLFNLGKPALARVQGNFRLTAETASSDIRHIILDMGEQRLPVLEGQSVGILPPGTDAAGKPHLPRLYSISSPRDGEKQNSNNFALTVKREPEGLCSNYLCDLEIGSEVQLTGPFGATFLMPEDPAEKLLMICTGTGAAPFRGFTMRRQRTQPERTGQMALFFGARSPEELPYFGPLGKVSEDFMAKFYAFSRVADQPKAWVQDRMREESAFLTGWLADPQLNVYICGLKEMEDGVHEAFAEIAGEAGMNWPELRDRLRDEGRYHVETY
jgi:benzoyl-CoA 2,3-dioxygenase component A